MTDYVELRARSAFSFLEGASLPEDLASRAAELGYDAMALGDRDGVYGQPRFHQAAAAAGITPIVGADATLEDGSRLYLLAPYRARYKNLCRLLTDSKLRIVGHEADGSPKYPAKGESSITFEDLEKHGNGLICLAGGSRSLVARALTRGYEVRPLVDRLKGIFGPHNLFLDLQRHSDADEERLNRKFIALAETCCIPVTATNDVCYVGTDRRMADVLTCIGLGTTLEEAGRKLWLNGERYLKSPSEMQAVWQDLPRAAMSTKSIAERCEFTLGDLGYRFPDYPLPPGETPDSYLHTLTYCGARERWGGNFDQDQRYRRQLEHELTVIERLKLAGYFLIVWDIVEFCRENRIMARGRGSAANSAVCYALGITAVDAVKMELLFERFLSEERGEWPDIDIDLPSGDQRERVIQYVYRCYGERGAAMTANVITYRSRSAIREVGKVVGFTPEQIDRLAKLNDVYEFQDEHDALVARFRRGGIDADAPRIKLFVELVQRIQAIPRHLGQHSGGMVIAAQPLDEIVPLEPASMPGRVVVQWDKEDCADLGIIKIDLLGLGMLAALEDALPLIRAHEGIDLDLAHLPQDDPATYEMICRADTIGVFQIESRAQMATLPRLKPKRFYDLVCEVALIRPGPITGKMVHPFLARRNNREPVRYAHPLLEPILKRTLGVALFQEQLLRIAMVAADFTGGQAEELRRAMGFKRSTERMKQIEIRLREGMRRKGLEERAAEEVVQSITSFAAYGFPESHSASFALIAYASSYLKRHHPAAFLAALLNAQPMGFYSPATLVKDAQRHDVPVLAVDVARSNWSCTLEQDPSALAVRLGLRYISGLRQETGERIEQQRSVQPFSSTADFTARVGINKREVDSLAHGGAFSSFGLTRRDALWQVSALDRDPASLFARVPPATIRSPLPQMDALEETAADFATTGLTTARHPMSYLRDLLRSSGVLSAADLGSAKDGSWVSVAGVVIVRQRPGTAQGFLFVTLEDETGLANAIVTPDVFQQQRVLLRRARILKIGGPLQKVDGVIHVRARKFEELQPPSQVPESRDFK